MDFGGRQRIVKCLLGEKIDRVPFGIGLGWQPWAETLDRWKKETGNPALDIQKELDFDQDFISPKMASGIFPFFKTEVLEETSEYVIQKEENGITLKRLKLTGAMPEFIDYPVKNPKDWERIKSEKLNIKTPGRLQEDFDKFNERSKNRAVQVGSYPWGVFGSIRDLMGVENFLTGFYEYPEMVKDMMNHMTSLWLSLWEQTAKEVQIDHIHIWEDMSGRQGSLISPKMAEEFMMPCYDRISEFARVHNVKIISVDTDGDCSELVPLMMKHGVNMFFPFEVQAGNDILIYRKKYPELGICGGLDKRVLASGKSEIDKEVEKAREMVKQGRYIPGFDHLIPPETPWQNFKYAALKIKEVCYESC